MKNERDCAAWSKSLNHDGSGDTYAEGIEGKKTWEVQGNRSLAWLHPPVHWWLNIKKKRLQSYFPLQIRNVPLLL